MVKPSDHICNIYKGVIYISETDLSKMSEHADETYKLRYDTYVYDISTGKMDLLEKGLGYDVLVNDYIVLDEFTEDSSVFVRVYLKKITDEGLETVKKFDDGYEVAQCDPDKKIITFSTVCEDGYTYWDEDKAIEFDTKTGKFIKGVK